MYNSRDMTTNLYMLLRNGDFGVKNAEFSFSFYITDRFVAMCLKIKSKGHIFFIYNMHT